MTIERTTVQRRDAAARRQRHLVRAVSSMACAAALIIPVGSPAIAEVTAKDRLKPGQTLEVGERITSRGGQYVLVMQADGNLVEYVGGRALWATNTYGRPGTTAIMQPDGNLVLRASEGAVIWSTRTAGHHGAQLVLRPNSLLNVQSRGGAKLWSSDRVDSQLDPGRGLEIGWTLYSPDRRYELIMQPDGNLVLYQRKGRVAVWDADTWGHPGSDVIMQSDGNLVIYEPGRGAIWSTRTAGNPGTVLRVEDLGRLVLYAPGRVPVWATPAAGDYVIEDRDDLDEVRSVAFQMATDRGWGAPAQISCIDQLFERESGWRWNADNPYSAAYGIPQANPGSKMATEGPDWRDNPVTQIKWGYRYIDERYGTPCVAWQHFLDHGWYRAAE